MSTRSSDGKRVADDGVQSSEYPCDPDGDAEEPGADDEVSREVDGDTTGTAVMGSTCSGWARVSSKENTVPVVPSSRHGCCELCTRSMDPSVRNWRLVR